jgi:hypothetical protein
MPADMRKGCAFPSGTTVVEAAPQASGVAATYFFNGNRKGESLSAHQAAQPQSCVTSVTKSNLTTLGQRKSLTTKTHESTQNQAHERLVFVRAVRV